MSTVAIYYDGLKNAKEEAKGVAKKLDKYADSIEKTIYNKIKSYSGEYHENIVTARTKSNIKISQLRGLADKYENYANNLENLKNQCVNTDEQVKKRVSSLTASFKSSYGIKDSKVQNTIGYFFTSIKNSSAPGRWIGDKVDQFESRCDYLKESIEDWYEFEGGEQLIKGTLEAVFEIAIAVVAIVGAVTSIIVTGGASLVVIASLIGGIIGFYDGMTNLFNEGRAYYYTRYEDDPATGKRMSELNTLADTIRVQHDSKAMHYFATGLDIVSFVCAVIEIGDACGELLEKGYKWTKNVDDIGDLKLKDILTKDNFKAFGNKVKKSITGGFTDLKKAVKAKDYKHLVNKAKKFGSDFINNLTDSYFNFDNDPDETLEKILDTTKDIVTDGFNLGTLFTIALPNMPIADIPDVNGKKDSVKIGDILDIINDINEDLIDSSLFDGSPIKKDVLEKLSTINEINISVPEIHVPQIGVPKIEIPNIRNPKINIYKPIITAA